MYFYLYMLFDALKTLNLIVNALSGKGVDDNETSIQLASALVAHWSVQLMIDGIQPVGKILHKDIEIEVILLLQLFLFMFCIFCHRNHDIPCNFF